MGKKYHIASEKRSFDETLGAVATRKKWTELVLSRLRSITTIPDHARILDVGAGGGEFLIACSQLGHRCEGIEPWEKARLNAKKVGEHLGIPVHIVDGTAESIPYDENVFDVVHAAQVIEHVVDVDKSFEEIRRVLRPGGVFWFSTESAMCPRQGEIRGFPLFGWYPDSQKRKIMHWVKDAKPYLVGYTRTPAINWFTPSKARNLLHNAGFQHVYDRWDLRGEDEGGRVYKTTLRAIRSTRVTKIIADVMVSGCSYAAI